jgi:hypothetical protein
MVHMYESKAPSTNEQIFSAAFVLVFFWGAMFRQISTWKIWFRLEKYDFNLYKGFLMRSIAQIRQILKEKKIPNH